MHDFLFGYYGNQETGTQGGAQASDSYSSPYLGSAGRRTPRTLGKIMRKTPLHLWLHDRGSCAGPQSLEKVRAWSLPSSNSGLSVPDILDILIKCLPSSSTACCIGKALPSLRLKIHRFSLWLPHAIRKLIPVLFKLSLTNTALGNALAISTIGNSTWKRRHMWRPSRLHTPCSTMQQATHCANRNFVGL